MDKKKGKGERAVKDLLARKAQDVKGGVLGALGYDIKAQKEA